MLGFGQQQWGIFDENGGVILNPDSVYGVDYAHDYRISDAPQEKGAFMSYNKVQQPWQSKVSFLVGDPRKRRQFLNACEQAIAKLDLVSVVTPEITYSSANLTHVGYRRIAQRGTTLILIEVWAEEVRIVGQSQLQNTASTNGAPTTNNGNVQGTDTSGPTAGNGPTNNATSDPTTNSNNETTVSVSGSGGTGVGAGNESVATPWDNLTANQRGAIQGDSVNQTLRVETPAANGDTTVEFLTPIPQ